MAKPAKVEPTYMKGNQPLRIALDDVVRVVKMLQDKKHTKKFLMAAEKNQAFVSVPPDTVNFIKDYMAENGLHQHPVGKPIVNARGLRVAGDPYDCNFGKGH